MLEGVLFFILGIAVTSFILILIAPFIWRRMLFFVRKTLRSQLPFSLEEMQADRKFLCAQHAVQITREKERSKLLQKINEEQQRQLARTNEHLQSLKKLADENTNIGEQLTKYKSDLNNESEKIEQVFRAQSENAKNVQDLYFSEKLVRVDIAGYEQALDLMDKKISVLMRKYMQLTELVKEKTEPAESI